MASQDNEVFIYRNPALLLQKLIRFNTTNPPGNEVYCINFINGLLQAAGIETVILGLKPERPNLIARLKGSGAAPPLLLYGHIDVVSTEGQKWKYPPFEGIFAEGCIWGRGALDMKGAVAMMVSVFIRARVEGFVPRGDIILAVVSDEEDEGKLGARYLVEQHEDLFRNVRYAIGELGGFTMHMGGKRFYPIMVSEKQKCNLKAVIKGPGGHGSIPLRNGAMAELAQVLERLNTYRLPVHITPSVERMIKALAAHLPFPQRVFLYGLLCPRLTDTILKLIGKNGSLFEPILHNTVNATIVHGGNKINIIPSQIVLELDGRILPGLGTEDIISELKTLLEPDIELEITHFDPGPEKIDMSFFDVLANVLLAFDSEAIPIPFVISGVTDARFFARLGIQTYGFTPMVLSKGMDFSKLIHAADERIPVEAVKLGANALFKLLESL